MININMNRYVELFSYMYSHNKNFKTRKRNGRTPAHFATVIVEGHSRYKLHE